MRKRIKYKQNHQKNMCRRLYPKVIHFERMEDLGKSSMFRFQVIMKVRSLIKVSL